MNPESLWNGEGASLQAAPDFREHVAGLDALRFFAVLWVVFGHIGWAPISFGLDRTHATGFFLHGLSGILWSGSAAMIVFFVISGFCIHFPYACGKTFQLAPYLIRRYVRIGIPMGAALLFSEFAGVGAFGFFYAILWSLVAELMYYTLYPVIRGFVRRFGIDRVVFCAS